MLTMHLYMAQRLSAMVMAPLVLGHLALIIYAVQDGLSAAEILSRTQGSVTWFLYYSIFVITASVHGAIGMRVIVHETTGLRGWGLDGLTWCFGLILVFMGARSVMAVTGL